MRKFSGIILLVLFSIVLVSCGTKTSVTAEIINPDVDQTSIKFSVELNDPENEITGSTVVYLYNEEGNVRNQQTIEEAADLEDIYFYGLETESTFTVKVIVTVGRDAVEVGMYEFTTLTDQEIIINTVEEFMAMGQNRNGRYILGQDIDFENEPFDTPFNASNMAFGGTFDGNGYSLMNINVSRISMYTGIFGYVSSGVIKNVTIDGASIGSLETPYEAATSSRVGILVGYGTSQTARIENVTVKNSLISFNTSSTIQAYVGGVTAEYKGVIEDVEVLDTTISVKALSFGRIKIGGVVGLLGEYSEVTRVYSNADISFEMAGTNVRDDDVSQMIGGVIGQHVSGADATEIISEGDITVDIDYNTLPDTTTGTYTLFVGGLVGRANDDINGGFYSGSITVNHEKNTYEDVVVKQFRIGGLVGLYEPRKASEQLVRISGNEININVSDDVRLDVSQVFGFDRYMESTDYGVFGTQHLDVNDISVVSEDTVNVITDLTTYFDSEWILGYIE